MEGLGGEEIEAALMDLGPLLGVSIKEEAPEETPEAPQSNQQGGGSSDSADAAETPSGTSGAGGDRSGPDSMASGSASSAGAGGAGGARCVLCGTSLATADGTPKLMECLHSTCEPCVKARIEEKLASGRDFLGAERMTITCPICRLQCQPSNMIDQRFVLEKVALEQANTNGNSSGPQLCNSCEEPEPASSYCTDCAEFICDSCVLAHQRLKITKDHTIKSKEEALAELAADSAAHAHGLYCRDHPQERLSLFCETCDRLTCRDCQLHHHRDHKYQFSTEMAQQARTSIASLLSEVSYKRVLLGSAMKVIRDRQQLIADKKKALVHEITQTVVKLTNAINSRGKQLVLRLSEVCDAKLRTLGEKKDALEQLAAITDHCCQFVNTALEQGSDTAVLYSKRAVCTHLQRVKSRRADIPNPEIPVRIALALDNLPELMRVLSTVGAIVVDGKVDGGSGSGGAGSGTTTSGGGGANSGSGTPGAAGAQGPYHPPPAASHSAVVALQHAAMHQTLARYQSYVQSVSGMGGGYLGSMSGLNNMSGMNSMGGMNSMTVGGNRARHHTPLRHPHVTSTTHPHHLHGMSELNLRGLLSPARGVVGGGGGGPRALMPAAAQQAMHHAYQQSLMSGFGGAFGGGSGGGGACRRGGSGSGGARTPSPAPPPLYHPPAAASGSQSHQHQLHHANANAAKWHIPQHQPNGCADLDALGMVGVGLGMGGGVGGDFKITLGRGGAGGLSAPSHRPPALVSSTNPKTPSPLYNSVSGVSLGVVGGGVGGSGVGGMGGSGGHGGGTLELDAVCADSVQDLMATIAKLDSNGVQVVAEGGGGGGGGSGGGMVAAPSPAPAVHSSTGHEHEHTVKAASDPNEDWCAVCMDGGELMCCDKCPKVFHQYCHIPTIDKLPDESETWQCLLCVNFAELPPDADDGGGADGGVPSGLTPRQQKLVERITLELYCQYEASLPFREPVSHDNTHYYSKITRPMCLDMIRMKLQPRSGDVYPTPGHFVADVRLMFRNAYAYNPPDSQIYKDAKRLEDFFEAQLVKWLPDEARTVTTANGSPSSHVDEPPHKRHRQ